MIDRRVARTRALLHRAHLALIVEKGYEAVTVEGICKAADVGRSTFYAHYPNKEALHRGGLDTLRRELVAHAPPPPPRPDPGSAGPALAFSLPMFEHARDHLDLYRALTRGPGGGRILDEIRQMVGDLIRSELAGSPTEREFTVRYLAGAYLSVLTWWLDGGAQSSPREMDAMFRRLAANGLRPAAKA